MDEAKRSVTRGPVADDRVSGSSATESVWERSRMHGALAHLPVIAVLRAPSFGDGGAISAGLVAGGVRAIEFTLTASNAYDAIEQARRTPDAVVGAGSVTDVAAARRAVEAGAEFVVCPVLARDVALERLGVPVVLAGATPTELFEAWCLTGSPVKLFPVIDPAQVSSIGGPLPQVPIIPSGGIDGGNAQAYLDAGAVAVNVGSSLCPPAALESGDHDLLRTRALGLVEQLGAR